MAKKATQSSGRRAAGRARMAAYSAACGLLCAGTLAGSMVTVGFREMPDYFLADTRYLQAALISTAVFAAVGGLCYLILAKFPRIMAWADGKEPLARLALESTPANVAAAAGIILAFWLPYLVLQYPCAMNGDTYNQLYQFQTSDPTLYTTINTVVPESYIDHHPVFDTLLFGAFLTIGDWVGSQNAGLFAFSLFQSALTAGGLSLVCCYMHVLGVPKPFRLVSLGFSALFPVFPMWAATMLKDPLNAAVFIYYMVLFAEAVRTRGSVFSDKRMVAAYVALACLCIVTKKSSFIVVLAGTVALAAYLRSHWAAMAVNLVAPAVISLAIVPALLYPAIGGVAAGGKQEAFGFAFQQVATAAKECDDLSGGEREAVGAVLDLQAAEKVLWPSIVDPVKRKAREDATTADYLRFIPAYFSIGMRHPGAYAYSILSVCGTLIAPGRTYTFFVTPTQESSWIEMFENADKKGELHLDFAKPPALEKAARTFDGAWRAFVPALGPLQAFFNSGFYGGWIPIICLVFCLYGRKADAVALVPIVAALGIVVISPASSTRYALPMLYTTTLMLAIACHALRMRLAPPAGGKEPEEVSR